MKKFILVLVLFFNQYMHCMHTNNFSELISVANLNDIEDYLKNGGDVNTEVYYNNRRSQRCTALHLAIKNNNTELVKLLLKWGIDTNRFDSLGYTALQHVITNCDFECAKVLLNHKDIDVNKTNILRDLPIITAINNCYKNFFDDRQEPFDVFELILKKTEINLKDSNGKNILQKICEKSFALYIDLDSILKLLKLYNIEFNAQDDLGNTPLFIALKNSDQRLFRLLLKHGADIDYKNNNGETVLHKIDAYTNLWFIKYILQNFENINQKNADGRTALSLLIELYYELKRANPNNFDNLGGAILLRKIKLLACYGANIEEMKDKHYEIYAKIKAFKQKVINAISEADLKCLHKLAVKGYTFNFCDDNGNFIIDCVADFKNIKESQESFNLEEEKIKQVFGFLILNKTKFTSSTIPLLISNGRLDLIQHLLAVKNNI